MRPIACLFAAAAMAAASAAPAPQPTRVMVRVTTHDAKLIGEAAGGVKISVHDAASGELLAEGLHTGGTGDTEAIVVEPRRRGADVYATEGAAGFLAELAIERPTLVEIRAEGPLEPPHAAREARLQTWVLPGEDVLGDGFVITLYGYAVEIRRAQAADDGRLHLDVHVAMLCTCPLTPGGLWDADAVEVLATLRDAGGKLVAQQRLAYAGEPSRFAGSLPLPGTLAGHSLEVTAADRSRASFGRHAVTLPR